MSKFEAYRAIDSILNCNIHNFSNRYGVDFEEHFQNDLQLVRTRTVDDYYFMFVINKAVASDGQGVLKTGLGRIDVILPSTVLIYFYLCTAFIYTREMISLNEYT